MTKTKNIISIGTVFLSIFLIICGLLVATFFKSYKGDMIPNPNLWFLGGMFLFALGLGILFMAFKQNVNRQKKQVDDFVTRLKQNGTPITVNLRQCGVESHHTETEKGETNSQIKAWNGVYAGSTRTETVHEYDTYIIFNHNETTYHSEPIPKPEATVRMLMEIQKETVLYVDEKTGEYYFDVAFLDA